MLSYSKHLSNAGAHLLLASATKVPFPSERFDLIVSSLGDPYNNLEFWEEVSRLLRPRGVCLFTTPSPEWASRFRSQGEQAKAEFVLRDGHRVWVPSLIPDQAAQKDLITDAGLRITETEGMSLASLNGLISPKLRVSDNPAMPVVRGYVVQKWAQP
jgi:SAM-dependent methyltransferase